MKLLSRFLRDRRGSGIVTVLVCMLLVVTLGATLLYVSYTGYLVKVGERRSTLNFYDAETAMSEIRAGVQQAVTESIAAAYSIVLVEYNSSSDTEGAFRSRFEESLFGWETEDGAPLFTYNALDGTHTYNAGVLISFIRVSQVSAVTVTGSGTVAVDEDTGSISLKDIRVRYAAGGYETNISSDISVKLPGFTYSMQEYSLTGIPEFALIADLELSQAGGAAVLDLSGSAYAGALELGGTDVNRNTLTVSGGTMICDGNISVAGSGVMVESEEMPRFELQSGASLWAQRISIGANSSVLLSGEDYIADDLTLDGNGARAVLSGRYYGFGYFANAELGGAGVPASSSSILINGRHTTLDLSGLTSLMLAGHSFINVLGEGFGGSDVLMGQSVGVKSDQLAYLLPVSSLSVKENPYVYTGDTLSYSVDFNTVLWDDVTLGDYIDADHVQVAAKTLTGDTHIVYFFMRFDTKADANNYFKEYFSHNSEAITEYLQVYADALASASSTQSSGSSYNLDDGTDVLTLLGPSDEGGLSVRAVQLSTMYENLCVTLSSSIPAASTPATSPFGYVVNTAAVDALSDDITPFTDEEGEVRALIVTHTASGNLSISEAKAFGDDVCLIVAQGVNISVNEVFRGLIITDGTVSMSASLYADPSSVTGALRATTALDGSSYSLLHFMNVGASESGGGEESSPDSTWDTDALVGYANWKKF